MKKIAVGMVIAVTAVLMVVSSPVYAQDAFPPDRPGRMGGAGRAGAGTMGARMAGTGLENLDAAAEDLGMTVAELQEAIAAGTTLHDLYLAAGLDLPEWAQQYLYDYSADRQADLADRQADLADLLGITVEELQAAMADGLTVHDLAAEAGITLPFRDESWMNGSRGIGTGTGPGTGTMAEALGLTIEELEAEIAAGNTLRDLFDASGLEFPAGSRGSAGQGGSRGGR